MAAPNSCSLHAGAAKMSGFVIAAALLSGLLTTSAASTSSPSTTRFVDLSYQHHLDPASIAGSVGSAVAGNNEASTVVVDISSTFLGDDGMSEIMKALAEQNAGEGSGYVSVDISARTNRLTSSGAAFIFKTLHVMSQPQNDTCADATEDEQTVNDTSVTVEQCPLYVESLDISLNDIGDTTNRKSQRNLAKALKMLVEGHGPNNGCCPRRLRLDCCGLGPGACRAIGEGILNAAQTESKPETQCIEDQRRLSSLHLSGNELIGDAGAAALAAALRTAPRGSRPLLETLDLSCCGVSDAGCEALAMAIRDNPGCVKNLDLSNNKITDDGAASLGLAASHEALVNIDLSNNKDITDRGASALAAGVERGAICALVLRSCSIRADGAAALGKSLCALVTSKNSDENAEYSVDLSGNVLGTLQVKRKKNSASLLKSKASATTAATFGFIGKKLRSGLKDAGIGGFVPSAESDDDEEELMGEADGNDNGIVAAGGKCGARAFSDAIIGDDDTGNIGPKKIIQSRGIKCLVGMRHCFLDERAADALAAAIIRARDENNLDISIDSIMNGALDSDVVVALREREDEELLSDMAQRHFDALEALRISRQRAREAAEAAAARARAESAFGNALGEEEFGDGFGGFDDYDVGGYEGEFDDYDDMMF